MNTFFQKTLNPSQRLKIAFVNPPHADWCLPQTMTWLYMKDHYNTHGRYKGNVEWLTPPYKFDQYQCVQDIWEEIKDADVVLYSSYVWNYTIVDELAAYAKSVKPSVINLLGGPQVGYRESGFLKERAMYDFVAIPTSPGEIFVEDFINAYFEQTLNYENISYEIRSCKKHSWQFLETSIYRTNFDFIKKLADYAQERELEKFIVLETTRGCPYKCAYCEWGGGIGNKILKKSLEVVDEDLRAISEAGYVDVYSADANFGVFFERDYAILKAAQSYGICLTDISIAKSKKLAVKKKLIDAFYETGMTSGLNVSIQSISDEAMDVAGRTDLSFKDKLALGKYVVEKAASYGHKKPTIEMIMAMPGSTLADFYREYEIYEDFDSWSVTRHTYMVLPDSDISKKEYCDKYQITLVDVYTDNIDEDDAESTGTLYRHRRSNFKTIASSYSFTNKAVCVMFFMNLAGPAVYREIYPELKDRGVKLPVVMKMVYGVLSRMSNLSDVFQEIEDIFNPQTPARNINLLQGQIAAQYVDQLIVKHKRFILSAFH